MKKSSLFVLFFIVTLLATANVKLPFVFSSGMVLQREAPIHIYGWASSGERLSVTFCDQIVSTTADISGKWALNLSSEQAGGPYQLIVEGDNKIVLDNVLIGDVWICSGQSNMEFKLNQASAGIQEIEKANYPMIRHLNVPKRVSFTPEENISSAQWDVCTPQNAGDFTAVGYYFAVKLYQELKIPIGLINSSWGGTNVETWTSRGALCEMDDFKEFCSDENNLGIDAERSYKNRVLQLISDFQGDNLDTSDVLQWKDFDYDDTKWTVIKVPQMWDEQGLSGYDGVVWYRKEFILTKKQSDKAAQLMLAPIDDSDETFINGKKVGESIAKYGEIRNYHLDSGILKEGKNVVAIKITDTGGLGGIIGQASSMKITLEDNEPISLAGQWKAKVDPNQASFNVSPNSYPSLLHNGMISPLTSSRIKGVIWYQGEENANRAKQYQKVFPCMINDWRNKWQQGDFPFYFVQLASFNANNQNGLLGSKWAELREAQTMALQLKNTGMAVTIDIGNPTDIHPTNKFDVGLRLALHALRDTYGKNLVACGPLFKSMKIKKSKCYISFIELGSGLKVKGKNDFLTGFQVAGADKIFRWAKAYVKGNKVVVFNMDISDPIAVRYCWVDNANEGALYNKEGLPASPFRTDEWRGLTDDTKYITQ